MDKEECKHNNKYGLHWVPSNSAMVVECVDCRYRFSPQASVELVAGFWKTYKEKGEIENYIIMSDIGLENVMDRFGL